MQTGMDARDLAWRKANYHIFLVFTTLWSLVLFVAQWRHVAFLSLLALAAAIDVVRLNEALDTKLFRFIQRNRYAIVGALVFLFAIHTWIVLSQSLSEFGVGGAYLHYSQSTRYSTNIRAVIVYIIEAASSFGAYLWVSYNTLRYSSTDMNIEAPSIIEKMAKFKRRHDVRHFFFVTIIVLVTLIIRVVDGSSTADDFWHGYLPASSFLQLGLIGAAPFLMSLGMKYWMAEVGALNNAA